MKHTHNFLFDFLFSFMLWFFSLLFVFCFYIKNVEKYMCDKKKYLDRKYKLKLFNLDPQFRCPNF